MFIPPCFLASGTYSQAILSLDNEKKKPAKSRR
ncbi:hypothetical protein EaACW_1869 [Erwinia amylovora ACW56400]|uniref:Uncharacterized protein n=1 Tax=Erwinia amylovora NBRC 12687 = CFBP 1232 TaxID=1219359 RepID=A0A831A1K0_ERWAM|nr:hypothetical protein EaACW_1869 [Erwinia amylovora ACW56400]CCO78716.1 hypothetical protein BN432_1918 [Erwinia amylovora Ea356]CCO86295.1 hypothetical protein BN434_1907 [Erwinia amylovora CFBP 2585]CCO90081.1 hypothetical protein BN435_1910 [Erwinia amylovora 01SFR-BO]CCO93844.1 hypothetical protein BN437_1914 [Erwinia amylovora NBRC 12687 = CFBP 1232]CCO99193.1 hypothetical protein BN438_1911 [Erwinia amylovora UPN527]